MKKLDEELFEKEINEAEGQKQMSLVIDHHDIIDAKLLVFESMNTENKKDKDH